MLNNESANQAATVPARTLVFVKTENSFWIALRRLRCFDYSHPHLLVYPSRYLSDK